VATTTTTDVDTAIPDVYSRRVLRSHVRNGFWGPFCGPPGSGMPIIQQAELLNNPGDTVHIQVTNPLSGAGVSGDNATLTGNEEKLTTSEMTCIPVLWRHAVRGWRRAAKKSMLDIREEATLRLGEWGMDKLDNLRFSTFLQATTLNGGTYTPNIKYAGAATSNATISTAMTMTVSDVRKVRALLANNKCRPMRINGRDWFFMVVHPFAALDLSNDTVYNTAVTSALPRAEDNPIFTGAIAAIGGMVIYESFNVPYTNGGVGGTVPIQKAIAFGREAFVEGLDENVTWFEESFDYGSEWGVAYSFAVQSRRALELSSIQYQSALNIPS
jgi:N4-gp56 family major capsid protein